MSQMILTGNGVNRKKETTEIKGRTSVSGSQIYCGLITACHWINSIRLFSSINPTAGFGHQLFQNLIAISWTVQCSISATALFIGWHKKDALPRYFTLWSELHPEQEEAKRICLMRLRRTVVILSVVAVSVGFTNLGFGLYSVNETELFDMFVAPFSPDGNTGLIMKIVYVVVWQPFVSAAWVLSIIFAYIICVGCYTAFQKFNYEFRSEISSDGIFTGDLESYRKRHQKLCSLIRHADEYFCLHSAGIYTMNGLNMLLIVYNLFSHSTLWQNPLAFFMHCFWLTTGIISMAVICAGGAMVNGEVTIFIYRYININN